MSEENTDQPTTTVPTLDELAGKNDAVTKMFLHPCPKCGKEFTKPMALQMHHLRVHTDKLGDGFKWKKGIRFKGNRPVPEKTREEKLAEKRAYNRLYRERKGKTPHPELFKENKNKSGKGMPWSLARRRKFNATWRKKAMGKEEPAIQPVKAVKSAPAASVTFCPRCGCNVEVVRKAIEFADRV